MGGKIIFVVPPEYNLDKKQYGDTKDFLTQLSQERDISLYDFNENHYNKTLNNVDNFVDFVHLNNKGSRLFSSIL